MSSSASTKQTINTKAEIPITTAINNEKPVNEIKSQQEVNVKPKQQIDFENMNVKQLRQFVSSRGITASIYNKN